MREAVLDTRVDHNGVALVLFRGAPLQACSGLEMSAAVTAIAAWAAVNNGIVRMRTTLPDGSMSEDFIHGDGTVVPAVPAGSGRRTAAPAPVQEPVYQQTSHPVRRPQMAAVPVPAEQPAHHQVNSVPADVAGPAQPLMSAFPAEPAPVPPSFPGDPFTRMNMAESDPPRQPRRLVEAAGIVTEDPAARTQASWRMPLEDDGEAFDIEALSGERPPPSNPFRRRMLRIGAIILLALAAALLGVMFVLPAPEAAAAVPGLSTPQAPSASKTAAGIGDALPENNMLTFALAGGLAVAAGGAAGLLLTKAIRKPKLAASDDLDDELLLNELDTSPLPLDPEADPEADPEGPTGTDNDDTEKRASPPPPA